MKEDFIVPVSGLAAGKTCFSWHAGKEFFEGFDNEDIIDAGVSVSLEAEKSGREVSLDMSLEGSVTVLWPDGIRLCVPGNSHPADASCRRM